MPKITVEEVTLPAHWASALVNGDETGLEDEDCKAIAAWVRSNPHLRVTSCNDESTLERFDGLLTDCLVYQAHVQFTQGSGKFERLIYPAHQHHMPMAHHKAGLMFTASGYGRRIPTEKCIYLRGRRYRIYCRIFSNSGTCFINFEGRQVIVE
jgi:hypothetical protein